MHVRPALFPGRATPRQQQGKALELVPRGVHGGALSQALSPRGSESSTAHTAEHLLLGQRVAHECHGLHRPAANTTGGTLGPQPRDDDGALDCPVPGEGRVSPDQLPTTGVAAFPFGCALPAPAPAGRRRSSSSWATQSRRAQRRRPRPRVTAARARTRRQEERSPRVPSPALPARPSQRGDGDFF